MWTLEGLRGADPVLGLALLLVLAVVLADWLHRHARLPRPCGYMLVGALASPLLLSLLDRQELDAWKPLIDLAIGVLVFELGARIRPRWLIDNPALALTSLLEGLAAPRPEQALLDVEREHLLAVADHRLAARLAQPVGEPTATP